MWKGTATIPLTALSIPNHFQLSLKNPHMIWITLNPYKNQEVQRYFVAISFDPTADCVPRPVIFSAFEIKAVIEQQKVQLKFNRKCDMFLDQYSKRPCWVPTTEIVGRCGEYQNGWTDLYSDGLLETCCEYGIEVWFLSLDLVGLVLYSSTPAMGAISFTWIAVACLKLFLVLRYFWS